MMTASETLFLILVVLAFVEAQIALILAAIAYYQSKPLAAPKWEMLEEDKQREKEEAEIADRLAKARKIPESYEELKNMFRELTN